MVRHVVLTASTHNRFDVLYSSSMVLGAETTESPSKRNPHKQGRRGLNTIGVEGGGSGPSAADAEEGVA
jgi:hypothetical protein